MYTVKCSHRQTRVAHSLFQSFYEDHPSISFHRKLKHEHEHDEQTVSVYVNDGQLKDSDACFLLVQAEHPALLRGDAVKGSMS